MMDDPKDKPEKPAPEEKPKEPPPPEDERGTSIKDGWSRVRRK
jgi:hypothetical protein